MNQDLTLEDRTILAALEALETGSGQPAGSVEPTETAETLARLYVEVLGLVPCELSPGHPRPELRERILAAARGEASGPRPEPKPRPTLPSPPSPPSPIVRPLTPIISREMPLPPPRPARRSAWPLALAATLALALGGLSGWLLQQRAEQEATIRDLQARLSEEQRKVDRSGLAAAEVRQQMERMRQNFSLVTTPAVTVSPLHPVGGPGAARGMLFVAADHQHWYLALHDLPPAEPGRAYQLWWISGAGAAVSGGTFDARGDKVELYSETMPADTRDVVITLEAEGGAPRPTGPEILRAAGVYQIS